MRIAGIDCIAISSSRWDSKLMLYSSIRLLIAVISVPSIKLPLTKDTNFFSGTK